MSQDQLLAEARGYALSPTKTNNNNNNTNQELTNTRVQPIMKTEILKLTEVNIKMKFKSKNNTTKLGPKQKEP